MNLFNNVSCFPHSLVQQIAHFLHEKLCQTSHFTPLHLAHYPQLQIITISITISVLIIPLKITAIFAGSLEDQIHAGCQCLSVCPSSVPWFCLYNYARETRPIVIMEHCKQVGDSVITFISLRHPPWGRVTAPIVTRPQYQQSICFI